MNIIKFKEIEDRLDSSLRMKLNQIRTFLELRKASVMVGAGFSKNAEMGENVHMKDWGELCEDFYTSLYNTKPSDKDFRLKSALRLAQQIESTMGRTALDEIIKNSLPNDSISPGYLHKLLVSLSWRDIFTTNYDSLLEEAAVKAYRHYNVVTSKDSLIYQPHPRIVKLHGSFPDNRPFIITEEDYRTYPEHFPEFVNTIRQALIETQFCLIGFSGDDPNFLNWLGWFRDIMGNQMLPIYMIYVGSRPHDSEIKLLGGRKIEPIITEDISSDPTEAMDFILSYIGNKFKEDEKWSGKLPYSSLNKTKLKDSIEIMRKIRESYPDWIILPADRIEKDFEDCNTEFPFMGKEYSELEDSDKINFLYEYTWRLQTSFFPYWLENEWYNKALQEMVNSYDAIEPKEKKKIDYLSVTFLQILRITGNDEFKDKLQLFRKRISPNNTSLHRKLNYEETIWYLSHCDFPSLDKILASWNITPDDYRGTLWKSKILMEIGKFDEATKILEEALGNARRKLMTNSKSEYQTSAVTLLSECLCYIPKHHDNLKNLDENFRFKKYFHLCKNGIKTEEKAGISHNHGFNIGTHSTSWNSGSRGYIQKYIASGRYYMITEVYGIPIGSKSTTYNSEINQLALPLIADINLEAAILYLIETNDKKTFREVLSRKQILRISEEDAIKLYDLWIKVLEPLIESREKPVWYERECNVVLPMVARLCVWLDSDKILKIIYFIWSIHDSCEYDTELLLTCYNSLPNSKATELWWEALRRPIYLNRRNQDIIKPDIQINKWDGNRYVIDFIIEGFSNESLDIRRAALDRFCDINTVLPIEYQKKIDNATLANFDNLLNLYLISILGINLQIGEERIWKDKFMMHLQDKILQFLESDFKISGSSVPVSTFDNYVTTFIDCYRHLTQEQVNKILKKILEFLDDNYEMLRDTNDSESLFGGLKRFLDLAMNHINIFIARIDASSLQNELRNELLMKFKLLSSSYPLIRTIVRLSFIGKFDDTIDLIKENREFVKDSLEKDVISSNHNRMREAFNAVTESQRLTNGNFSIQDIVKSVIDHIRYHLDSETYYILMFLPLWIDPNILAKQNRKALFKTLSDFPRRMLTTNEVSPALKSDLLYYGGVLAGQISKMEFDDVDKTKCIESWETFANSHDFPYDIRKGYFEGQS